jgi:methylphosphotriester-DNA--protein-cysteine methyltransferase
MTETPWHLLETPDLLDALIEALESLTAPPAGRAGYHETDMCWRNGLRNSWAKPPCDILLLGGCQLAKQMMREGASNIQEVAIRVGYDSEAAFNRAFKRATCSPPAAWRKSALSAESL